EAWADCRTCERFSQAGYRQPRCGPPGGGPLPRAERSRRVHAARSLPECSRCSHPKLSFCCGGSERARLDASPEQSSGALLRGILQQETWRRRKTKLAGRLEALDKLHLPFL